MRYLRSKLFLRGDAGQSLVETALALSLMVLLLAAAIDFGRAFYLLLELRGAAHAGAIYGSQYPTDTAGMKSVAQANAPDLSANSSYGFTVPTPTWGCECDNGTGYQAGVAGPPISCTTPTCSAGSNEVYVVSVTATANFSPLLPWPGIPSTMNMSETVKMRSGNF